VQSESVARLCREYGQGKQVILQACPGLVECVEAGELSTPRTESLLRTYIEPLLAQGVDTLVLGCTHYPFLSPIIRRIAGADVLLIDPADAVARELARRTGTSVGAPVPGAEPTGRIRMVTSDQQLTIAPVIQNLLNAAIDVEFDAALLNPRD
jgi:glutamate racemase